MKQRGSEEEEKGKQIHYTSRGLCQGKLPRCQMGHNDWLLVGLFLLVTVTNSLHKNNLSVVNSMKPEAKFLKVSPLRGQTVWRQILLNE